jgi:hypothetical protein
MNVKSLAGVFGVALILVTQSLAAAAATDPLTGLPLYSQAHYASSDTQNVCGTQVKDATYGSGSGNLATVDRWYAGSLHGFKMIHGATRNYPYDVFVNADLTKSVTILGSGPKTGVEGIVYHSNPKPASPANLLNWLDGGTSICR